MTDEEEDVMLHGYKTTETGDHPEIDIISLVSSASIQSITVELTMEDDVTDGFGYTYSISASGVVVLYQEGIFRAWRWVGEVQELDNVQMGVNGRIITAVIPRTLIGSELVLNATNQYLPPMDPDMEGPETYYDEAGEIDGVNGSPGVGGFEKELEDDSGDVVLRYWAVQRTEDQSLDIIEYSIDQIYEGTRFELSLMGDVADDPRVNYTLYGGGIEVRYSNGKAYRVEGGAEFPIDDVAVDGNHLEIIVETGEGDLTVGLAFAAAIRMQQEGAYSMDTVPEDPFSSTDLLPFAPGSREDTLIEVLFDLNVVVTRSFSGFTADESYSIRSAMDENDDGSVSEDEMWDFFRESILEVQIAHGAAVKMDAKAGDLSVDLDTEGMIGLLGSPDVLTVKWTLNYSFSDSPGDSHTFEMDYPTNPLPEISTDGSEGPERELHINIILDRGFKLYPLTLRPEELANSMNMEANRIEHTILGREADDFRLGDLQFEFYMDAEKDDDDDDDASGDGEDEELWPFILILIAMVTVMAAIFVWSRSRET
ncbi:MAG: hypothetical protein ACMUIE_07250 [Thermoplasmatota archaeon]